MNELITYILKASAGVAIVAIPYYLFLRNDSALKVKRIYLILGILLSWIFPLISIQKPELVTELQPVFLIDINEPSGASNIEASKNTLALHQIVYLIGLSILLVRGIIGLMKIRTFRKNSITEDSRIFYSDNIEAFTFFRRVFMPTNYENSDKESILIHEQAHVRQMHFIDMLIAEFNLVFTWFNPFSWLISRMIKENHEHLADRAVLSAGVHPAQYKALLLNHAMGGQVVQFGHQFNQSLTKKRFTMMRKLKTTGKGLLKYAFIIPAILTFNLLTTASCQNASTTIKGKVYLENKDVPGTGASVVIKNSTVGTVVDREGKFTLEVEGNPEVIISFVGYETLVQQAKAFKSAAVILKPTTLNIPLEYRSKEDIFFNGKKPNKGEITIKTKDDSGEEPIYVLDGEVIDDISVLNPDDIASINVIKDSDNPLMKKYKSNSGLIVITSKEQAKEDNKNEVYTSKNEEEVFYVVEDVPSFPGGKDALRDYVYKNLSYPTKAKDKKLEGEALVGFTVTTKGTLENIHIMSSSDKIFDEAAMDVFRDMPAWNPGKQRGKAIKTIVSVPVKFKLSEN